MIQRLSMQIRFEDFELDSRRFLLRRRGEKVALRPKVFDLLTHLARNRERVVSREELVAELWGGTRVGAGSLAGLVNELRRALGESGRGPSSIRTVHARGYQFVAPVAGTGRDPDSGNPASPSPFETREPGLEEGASRVWAPESSGGEAAALDRIRVELGRVLQEGARGVVLSVPSAGACSRFLDRAVSLAGHLGFEGFRFEKLEPGEAGIGSLERRWLDALIERRGLAALRARLPAEIDVLLADEAGRSGETAERPCLWTDALGRIVRRLSLEHPMLVVIESLEALGPDSFEFLSSMSGVQMADSPILFLTTRERESGDELASIDPGDPGALRGPSGRGSSRGGSGPISSRSSPIAGFEVFHLVVSERTSLDDWLSRRGIEPLPEALADALVRHLQGRGHVVADLMEQWVEEAESGVWDRTDSRPEDESRPGRSSPRRMRRVRPRSRSQRQVGDGFS